MTRALLPRQCGRQRPATPEANRTQAPSPVVPPKAEGAFLAFAAGGRVGLAAGDSAQRAEQCTRRVAADGVSDVDAA